MEFRFLQQVRGRLRYSHQNLLHPSYAIRALEKPWHRAIPFDGGPQLFAVAPSSTHCQKLLLRDRLFSNALYGFYWIWYFQNEDHNVCKYGLQDNPWLMDKNNRMEFPLDIINKVFFFIKKQPQIFFTVTSRSLDKYPTSPLIFITLRHEKYEGPSLPPAWRNYWTLP